MDSRLTLNVNETFLQIVESSFKKGEKVHLLLDENGIERAEGLIHAVHKDVSGISIELNDGKKIDLKNIVAINGVFRPEYGEC
jgi:hypothetical protein